MIKLSLSEVLRQNRKLMVEVFKTNVVDSFHANMLVEQIQLAYTYCKANFDLDDCDKILRVESLSEPVQPALLIGLLSQHGYHAEVLPDELPG